MNVTQQDYADAIQVQNACNLKPVVNAFADVLDRIHKDRAELSESTDWVREHPISVMYASKIASLTDCELFDVFTKAYSECRKMGGLS